jgi:hypothetical protein
VASQTYSRANLRVSSNPNILLSVQTTLQSWRTQGRRSGRASNNSRKDGHSIYWQVILQILNAAISGFLKIATLAMVPIFLATPPEPLIVESMGVMPRSIFGIHGGFGMDTTSISNVLLVQAVAAMICQILVVPHIIDKEGPLWSYRVVVVALIILYCLLPFSANLPRWLSLPAVLVILWAYALVNGLGTT